MQRTALVVVEGHVRNEVQYVAPSCRLPPHFWRWWWGGGPAASAAAQQCPPPERPRGVRSTATSASAAGWTPCVARAQRWAPPAPARWCRLQRLPRGLARPRCWVGHDKLFGGREAPRRWPQAGGPSAAPAPRFPS